MKCNFYLNVISFKEDKIDVDREHCWSLAVIDKPGSLSI